MKCNWKTLYMVFVVFVFVMMWINLMEEDILHMTYWGFLLIFNTIIYERIED